MHVLVEFPKSNRTLLMRMKPGVTLEGLKAKYPNLRFHKTPKPPGHKALERMVFDGIAKAVDGCRVEPDGTCEHGKPSWLLALGLI